MAEGETKAEKRKIKITIADSGRCCDADLSPDLREDILKTVGEALSGRENVVMTRLNDPGNEEVREQRPSSGVTSTDTSGNQATTSRSSARS